MKAEILKIAGVKSEKEFYKKYPSEEAFMKVHAKAFKKAQVGASIGQSWGNNSWANSGSQYYDPNSAGMSGQPQPGVLTGGTMMSAQQTANQPITSGGSVNLGDSKGFDISKGIPLIGNVTSAFEKMAGAQRAKQAANQTSQVANLFAIASGTQEEKSKRKWVSPWDNVQTGETSFPVLGVGTNPITKNGGHFRKAQNGTIETPEIDNPPTDWYEEGMDKDTYYGFKKELDDAGYQSIARPDEINVNELQQITEAQPDANQMSDQDASAFMETYNRDQGVSTSTFDSKSARDNWVQKTGLPWSEAKRLGYTSGSAKDNTKLLSELNDPRFKKENLRTSPSKSSSQSRTPVQHRETPTGRLTPIKPEAPTQSYAEAMKGKPKYSGNQGNIGAPDEGNMITRLGERLANPMQTFGHYSKYHELPAEGFSKYSKNAFDQAIGLRNPAYWINAVGNASDYASEGEYRKAVIEAADALPALGKIKYVKNVPFAKGLPAGKEYIKRAGYLGEGAKRISGPASKQLGQAVPKALGEGIRPNFVMYKDGGHVGGNPTEIQNTYGNGNSIYDNLEYAPLNMQKAEFGFGLASKGGAGFGENPYGGMVSGMFGDDGGGQLGGAIGSMFGPGGAMFGQAAGSILDTTQEETDQFNRQTKRSMDTMRGNQFGQSIRGAHPGHLKNGGYMNPEYNPQVITMFGDHNAQDFADYAHKDQYRAGGHLKAYTPPSERAMETYANGGNVGTDQVGDVSIESGGYLEPVSWNPHTGGTGFTSKFHGQSHVEQAPGLDHTGIIMKYGGNTGKQNGAYQMAEGGDTEGTTIEAERGEYISERKDGGEVGQSAQISGNRKYNSDFYDLGPAFNKEFEGKKVKAIQGIVANDDKKLNKFSDRNTQELLAFTPKTQMDKLKENALVANETGINMKYGINASKVNNILAWQNSANEVIDEQSDIYGKEINGDDFINSGGKKINFKKESLDSSISKNGGKYAKAQTGYNIKGIKPGAIDYNAIGQTSGGELWKDENTYNNVWKPKVYSAFSDPRRSDELVKRLENYSGQDADDVKAAIAKGKTPEEKKAIAIGLATDTKVGPFHSIMNDVIDSSLPDAPATTTVDQTTMALEAIETEEKKDFPWMSLINQFMPKPSDVEELDYAQLYPEMYAMGTNQLEPVPAQGYRPDLDIPYDISLQDQLNANQADYRSGQRMAGYNPAAQAMLNAQKYAANQGVLGEQFRLNQAQKAGVYGRNRDILNQSKLQNLGIFDKQYERQAQAEANTKATSLAALSSMSDKVAKNKLENRTLATYENLYNYRFDPNFKAQNYNPLAQFDTSVKGAAGRKSSDAPEGYEYETILKKKKKKEDVAKNGSIVKSYKNI